jgi:uncharacterized protein YgiM (DUF1202 family)
LVKRIACMCAALLGSVALLAACAATETPAPIVEISNQAAQPQSTTETVIYITPTTAPTLVPTVSVITPSATLPPATPTPTLSATPDLAQFQAQCTSLLETLYLTAGDVCLGKPNGYFCNGGLPPRAEPAGPVSSAMALPGSLVDAQEVNLVETAPMLAENKGGLMWLRLDTTPQMDALLVGSVLLRDVTPTGQGFPKWQSFIVITQHVETGCSSVPHSTFALQSFYGQTTRVVINGVSLDINGTLAVQTDATTTFYIVLEGQVNTLVQGQARQIYAGQMLAVPANADHGSPASIPEAAIPLDDARIAHLPVTMLDRPILLPQPGFVRTEGTVNMRSHPDANSLLLYAVPSNEILSILGKNTLEDWLHVRLGNGETGWMRRDLLAGEANNVNAVYDVTPQPPQRPGELGTVGVVIAPQGGNLRRAPDVSFPVLATIPEGTTVTLLERSPYSPWVKVDAGGQVGWMALIVIKTRAAVGFLPIDYEVPLPPRPTALPVFQFGGGHAYPDPNSGQ